jgi:hypothetical protein
LLCGQFHLSQLFCFHKFLGAGLGSPLDDVTEPGINGRMMTRQLVLGLLLGVYRPTDHISGPSVSSRPVTAWRTTQQHPLYRTCPFSILIEMDFRACIAST